MNKPILPSAQIGIIGGGQLGRMMALKAKEMGYKIAVLEPAPDSPTAQIADIEINGAYTDVTALTALLKQSQVVTYEFENISSEVIEELAPTGNLPQGHRPLAITQNRLTEKTTIQDCGFKTAPFVKVENRMELKKAVEKIGYPCILKTVSGGYDGKGQWALKSETDLPTVQSLIENKLCILEGFVSFDKELSVIVTRGIAGEIEVFSPIENIHHNHILHLSIVPANISDELAQKAETIAKQLIGKLDFVGTLAIEMFVLQDELVINELAPRPHNSGHLTIDACNVSQFEQHIRAVCGLPLIKPKIKSPAIMVNLLGQHVKHTLTKWQEPEFAQGKLHLYGKASLKKDRKVGHITFMNDDQHALTNTVQSFLEDFNSVT